MAIFYSIKNFLFPKYEHNDPGESQVRSFLILVSIFSYMSFQMWRSLFNNFAVEIGGVNAAQMGIIQSVREIPGFIALFVIILLIFIKEQYLALLSLAIMGLGILITGFYPEFLGILMATFLMSMGFHYFETLNQSLTLQHIPIKHTARFLGQVRSYGSLAGIIGILIVLSLKPFLSYTVLFVLAGSLVFFGVI